MSYSIKWNNKAGAFIARCKKPGGGYHTKQIPKSFQQHQKIDAEHWFIDWYNTYIKTFGVNVSKHNVSPASKTLLTLAPKWLDYRHNDPGTKPKTSDGFNKSVTNWILDNPNFKHYSLQTLDMEKGFTPTECINWINSITGATSSVLAHVTCIRSLFNDCLGMGWIEGNNPFDNQTVKKVVKNLYKSRKADNIITKLSKEDVATLLTTNNRKVSDYRKTRYVIAIATGMRDHEIQGLTWSDIYLEGTEETSKIPYLDVNKQLDKNGCKPIKRYEDLVRSVSKDDLAKLPNAIVSNPKRNSKRLIPLHPLAVAVLRYWFQSGWKLYVGRDPELDDAVFPVGGNHFNRLITAKGDFCHSDSAIGFRNDLARLNLSLLSKGKKLVFHSLRHTFSTLLANQHVEQQRISMLLGHAEGSVAGEHYVAKEVSQSAPAILSLPLPTYVQLAYVKIEAV